MKQTVDYVPFDYSKADKKKFAGQYVQSSIFQSILLQSANRFIVVFVSERGLGEAGRNSTVDQNYTPNSTLSQMTSFQMFIVLTIKYEGEGSRSLNPTSHEGHFVSSPYFGPRVYPRGVLCNHPCPWSVRPSVVRL